MEQHIAMDARKTIRTYLAKTCFADVPQIDDRTSFLQMGVLDSLGFLEMVAFLERTFGIEIQDDEMIPENMDSIQNILAFLERKEKA